MRKYYGAKPFGHDATLFELDCKEKEIFALSLERATRVKRDDGHLCLMGGLCRILGKEAPVIGLSFGRDNEYQALREVIPLEIGLLEHPLRAVLRNIHKTREQRLEEIQDKYGNYAMALTELWFKIEDLLYSNDTKHKRIAYEKWEEIHLRRFKAAFSTNKVRGWDHHTCHALSTYLHSNFDDCAIVTLDGWGNNCFSKVFLGLDGKVNEIARSDLKWTWGFLYGKVTKALGLFINSDEGKVEARAAYGEPNQRVYRDLMEGYIINDNLEIIGASRHLGQFWHQNYFEKLRDAIGEENTAATIQTFLQDKTVEYVNKILEKTGKRNLACAGGIFANVKMNQAIYERTSVQNIYVVPAMNDSGSAQGAAYLEAQQAGEDLTWLRERVMPYWGLSYTKNEVQEAVDHFKEKLQVNNEISELKDSDEALDKLSKAITDNKIVALFQGKAEYGPRALGNRSILANPKGGEKLKDRLNKMIKKREWYQPFCPSILESERENLFERSYANKHMTSAFTLKDQYYEDLKAVVHIDKTCRPQFLEEKDNPFYYALLLRLKNAIGYGVVLNTSFNLHGRAMVLTPLDALEDFLDCGLDALCIFPYWITRSTSL